ncbi:hypothetical protein PGAG_00016 [Phaeocystis globosa virus 12T]|uniref:Uncharacterized protein n=1 Tax=Phaeocystis globosa virus PgV-16T TaxID=3071227 RepID=A0AC59EWP6_9VIRU|nr:hypothetical protein PGCG_00056 [Phaeocystis globosa virus]AET72906.1 hypothetical protein PGAG_00016 [Phaeocystis globosa virus 12T]AET73724.1 hypothetical protein PGBG_00016 [Phaeocystis globosa virus 14T]AGM15368.1 hypothetical protein PGCG_00056 [Phaeocystis globosa virus PgV-16T]UYE94098.1 hypothetical protein PGV14T_00056 [Phaeocystis globosa virus]
MPSRAASTTAGKIKSTSSAGIAQMLANDNTVIPGFTGNIDDLIEKYLEDNKGQIFDTFDDLSINGTLEIGTDLAIGDASNDLHQVLQFVSTKGSNGVDQVIQDTVYESISGGSISFSAKSPNARYELSISLNYLTSTYVNTLLRFGLFYFTTQNSLSIPANTITKLIGEYTYGSENATFESGVFSKTVFVDISHATDDTIVFFVKAKIQTDAIGNDTDFSYINLGNDLKPKIIQTISGNIITIAEYNNFF